MDVCFTATTVVYLVAQNGQFKRNRTVQVHVGAWMVLLAWVKVVLKLADSPSRVGLYMEMIRRISMDALKFIATAASIIIGLGLAYHSIFQSAKST